MKVKMFFLILSVFLFSCSGSNGVMSKVEFEVLVNSFYSSVTEKKEIIATDRDEYIKIMNIAYEYLDRVPEIQEVDFNRYIVIAVFMGAKTSGGYSITVDKIIEKSDKITVYINEISPGKNCITTDAITYPFELIKIPKTDKKIIFKTRGITKDCG